MDYERDSIWKGQHMERAAYGTKERAGHTGQERGGDARQERAEDAEDRLEEGPKMRTWQGAACERCEEAQVCGGEA